MTYETSITELFERFPDLRAAYQTQFEYMGEEKPEPYIVFGSLLIPTLETALETANLRSILSICAFLEDAAESARKDTGLETLIRTEVGEWLGWAANEERLAPWLGAETKRICGYVPGLSTQRLSEGTEKSRNGLTHRTTLILNKLRGKSGRES